MTKRIRYDAAIW